jgi:hypothetical protein
MSDLLGYFQKPRIDSEGQLREAQRRNESAETLYLRQRQNRVGGSVPERGGRMSLDSLLSWHPKNTIQRASDGLRSARERR